MRQTDRQTELPSAGECSICLQWFGLGWAGVEHRSQKLNPGLPRDCQEYNLLRHHHCLPGSQWQKAGLESQSRESHTSTTVWNAGVLTIRLNVSNTLYKFKS